MNRRGNVKAKERVSAANIKRVLSKADAVDWREGLEAYTNYHYMMRALADYYAYPVSTAAAVFAALSPNNDYMKKFALSRDAVKGVSRWCAS